jgi:heme-degrading monooxygenase HmoA
MYAIVWRYRVRPDRAAEFERHYRRDGTWAAFFREAEGYERTELLRDQVDPLGYMTVDYWQSKADHERYLHDQRDRYRALDREFEELTEHEEYLGSFEVV